MKLVAVVIIGAFAAAAAIRVPTSWPKNEGDLRRSSPFGTKTGGENGIHARPYVSPKKYPLQQRHPNLERPQPKKAFTASATLDDWKPILPQKDKTRGESSHEVPLDIPTKPIYPGEGQWAKRGRKHRPFISRHKFAAPEEEREERPEGFEVFEDNRRRFEKKRQQFPWKKHPPAEESNEEDEEKQAFVPTKLYAQVRRIENEEHLPRLVEDPRLREVIRDSKIQTVYTEEGYEDLAYDHAGHEKNADEEETHSRFDKEIEKEKQKKARRLQPRDSEGSSSHKTIVKTPLDAKKHNSINNGNSELEILSEIKVIEAPHNRTKTYKYVTIIPKSYTTEHSEVLQSVSRRKRFINDFPEIKADADFIDKINHNLPKVTKKYEKLKYPYYNDPSINPYSPIRYAEDLENIPKKTEDELAFYHQADRTTECPEVETDIDPIPSRVKKINKDPENAEEETEMPELKLPRLKNLGDKIDCFKIKYFGEDPLDSPFFKEKEIGPVLPLFEMFVPNEKTEYSKSGNNEDHLGNSRSYSIKIPVKVDHQKEDLSILADVMERFKKPTETETTTVQSSIRMKVADVGSTPSPKNQTEASVISIITTPKYTIDLKPKHIYHQIELLRHLPPRNDSTLASSTPRAAKYLEETTTVATAVPESQALRYRPRRPRPKPPPFQIFDINQYLPPTSFSLLNRIIRTSTSVPHHGVSSEVHYKHEIKPSEQLNVFADVINNIKNSSRNSDQTVAASHRIAVKLNTIDDRYHNTPDLDVVDNIFLATSTKAPKKNIKYSSYKDEEELFEELANRDRLKYENLELLKINKRRTTTTKPTTRFTKPPTTASTAPVEEDPEEDYEEDTTVLGLMPPVPNSYKTIYNPALVKPVTEETKTNIFYVLGMKPPSAKQKILLYSDFLQKAKRPYLRRRGRRSARRPGYAEVVRDRNKPIDIDDDAEVAVQDDDDDDDDYVPHRPKNYHYDEKTGRIVYDSVKEETEAPEEEYVEVTEAPLPPPTRRNAATAAPAPKFKNFTGPSFVDFVNRLKSNPNYTEITDPPPTEKGEVAETTTTTTKPASTEAPEFLSILARIRSDDDYKVIKDKKTTTTEAAVETEEEREEETQLENVQNSPGGQIKIQNFQIFDINDYLPKIKTYTPRTPIDYSKYKTIERANSGSRRGPEEDSKSEETPEVEINPEMSESKHEDVKSSTTTEVTSTTRRARTRQQSRGSRRPTKRVTTSTSASVSEEPQILHDRPKRVYPRRRPARIRVGRTTTEVSDAQIEESTTAKVVRRRHQTAEASAGKIAVLNATQRNESRKIADVQVFEKYDKRKKHGGNLKEESEEESAGAKVERLSDIARKPSAYYTDVKLPKKINQLVEVKLDADQIAEVVESETEKEEHLADYEYEGSEDKTTTTTTKKPNFVRDPDKRLYYYAPI